MDAGTCGNALGFTGGVLLVTTRFSVVFGAGFDVDSQGDMRSTSGAGGSSKVSPEGLEGGQDC